jgi:hypothetical protein
MVGLRPMAAMPAIQSAFQGSGEPDDAGADAVGRPSESNHSVVSRHLQAKKPEIASPSFYTESSERSSSVRHNFTAVGLR